MLLGLATGVQCLSYCAPVLVTYLLGTGKTMLRNVICLIEFLLGRLLGYLLFGIAAYCAKFALGRNTFVFGVSYLLLSIMMILFVLYGKHVACPAGMFRRILQGSLFKKPFLFPVVLGFLTGINLCPPFLLALTETAASVSLTGSLLFFLLFFIGTSVYLLPLSFLGALKSNDSLKLVAKTASILIALYYACNGVLMILNQ